MKIYKSTAILLALLFSTQCAFSGDVWINDLRKMFSQNSAVIYEINMRTFAAQDVDGDGIIEFEEGEESGNFLNAISKLDELSKKGVNTLHILPITPTGKTKALGTAGSLYAASSFNTINPQLSSKHTALSVKSQAIKFVTEAHRKNIRIILDMPSCGAYDLYLKRPELFLKDKSGQPVVPSDWTDVRLFNAGNENSINSEVYNLFKGFVDLAIDIGADGIRADVAPLKPAKFWKELIGYSRTKDPQFLWLAEAYETQGPISEYVTLTSKDALLDAGFDGYYGGFANLKNMKNGKEFTDMVQLTLTNLSKFGEHKSVIGSFITHDEMSPLLVNGQQYANMILWLNSTLPINAYYTDGYDTGDNYIYMWANKEAPKTYTDDNIYFVHRGKLDIFNFSRQPGGSDSDFENQFSVANGFRQQIQELLAKGKFIPLRTKSPSVFAYSVNYKKQNVIVMGNLDFRSDIETVIYVPKLSDKNPIIPIKIDSIPITQKGGFKVNIQAGEIVVLLVNDLEMK